MSNIFYVRWSKNGIKRNRIIYELVKKGLAIRTARQSPITGGKSTRKNAAFESTSTRCYGVKRLRTTLLPEQMFSCFQWIRMVEKFAQLPECTLRVPIS